MPARFCWQQPRVCRVLNGYSARIYSYNQFRIFGFMRLAPMGLLIFFLAGSLVDFREWSKLPDLVTHFQEHRLKNPALSFAQFLSLHYGAGADHHQQEEPVQHKHLPYGAAAKLMSVFFCAHSTAALDTGAGMTIPLYFNLYESCLLPTKAIQTIWQPPRA